MNPLVAIAVRHEAAEVLDNQLGAIAFFGLRHRPGDSFGGDAIAPTVPDSAA